MRLEVLKVGKTCKMKESLFIKWYVLINIFFSYCIANDKYHLSHSIDMYFICSALTFTSKSSRVVAGSPILDSNVDFIILENREADFICVLLNLENDLVIDLEKVLVIDVLTDLALLIDLDLDAFLNSVVEPEVIVQSSDCSIPASSTSPTSS